jgi:putative redox protein
MENLLVTITRTDQKVHLEGVSKDNPDTKIPFDFAPPIGEGNGFAGLEMLLMTLAGCISTTLIFLLGRAGKHIAAFSATAEGIRSERPMTLAEARMVIRVKSDDVSASDMEAAIGQAQAMAPVWQAVKNNVLVKIDYVLS